MAPHLDPHGWLRLTKESIAQWPTQLASGVRPSDATRANNEEHVGGDVTMEGDSADENSGGHRSSARPDSSRRITTKREPREVRDEQSNVTEQHVPRRIFGENSAARARSCCHHARGTGWVPRENNGVCER